MAKTLYKQVLLLGWFLLTAFMGNAQSYEVWEGQLSGTGFAKDSVITVVDAKFGTPYYSTIQNSYKKKAVVALHTLENSAVQWPASFRCEVSLQINWWDDQNVEHIEFKTLAVNYSADTLHQDTIISYYTIEGAHKIVDSILDIYVVGLSQPLPTIFALKSSLLYDRDYDFECLFPIVPLSRIYKSNQNELAIYWVTQSWLTSNNSGNQSTNYQFNYEDEVDIEWTFYDDSSELIKSGVYPCTDLAFKNNASRVSVSAKEFGYDLPLMYESGYLLYRLRQVKVLPSGQRIVGPWTTQTHPNNSLLVYRINGHEDKLNWQAATTFAEEGKRKTVASYFDGSSKNRQTVTKVNTDSLAIVAETIYDNEGRPVVATLPSPSFDKAIQYFEKYNQNIAGQSYAWSDLDSISNGCINGPKVMSNTTGSSKYYSLNNPLKTVGHHAYVPEAFGFPFSQTQYTNDLTNRVKVSAGPGKNHHLGNVDERFTQYFYGAPTQSDLSRLFGQEVGHQSHYFKNMVMDPNGQVSITYQDMQGRTIATSLAGDLPTVDLKALDNRTDTVMLRDAIIMPGNQYIEGRSIKSTKNFLVANTSLHKFVYELFPESLEIKTCDSSDFCYDCVYDLDIKLTDDCGNLIHQLVRNNYNPDNALVYYFDTTCTNETPPILDSFELVLGVGSYSVTKSLTINSQAIDYYFNDYKAKDTCIRTFEDFYADALAEIDFSGCEVTCSSCLASLGTRQDFVNNFLNKIISLDSPVVYTDNDIAQANTAYDQLKTTCDMLCDSMNICDAKYLLMLQDMSPKGGQYATYDPATFTSTDAASIFHGTANFFTGLTGNTVPLFQFSGLVYTNSIGIPDTIWKENIDGELVPYLPNILSAEEFILYWKPSWAKALVRFHPEYCNYLFCVSIDESHAYDNAMLQTTEYDSAVIKGFLNPLNQVSYVNQFNQQITVPFLTTAHPDPFFATGAPGEMCKADVADRMLQYVNEPNFVRSLWELASISASCSTATACGSCTEGYYWNTFRNIYLGLKRQCVDDAMLAAQNSCARSLNSPHTSLNFATAPLLGKNRRFELLRDSVPVVNGGNNTINDVNDIMIETQALIDNNSNTFKCKDYASYWWGQLSSCGFNQSDSANIINNLIQVCQAGTDQSHPFGASTASPNYTGTGYTSFEQVLQDAAAASSPSINFPTATCTHYLINNPMPYHVTPLYYQNVQVDKPAECVCAKIVKHKFQYMGSSHASTMSFGQYLTNVKNIIISDEDVQILLAACSQNLCNILPKPVTLPYQFECNQACANCNQVTTVYTNFLNAYPNVHLHPNYMTLMQAYMNANLGMNLTSLEYFDFMYDSCGFTNFPPADDSVQTTMQLKKAPIADPTFSMAKLLQKYATPTKTNLYSDQLLSSNHTFVNPFTKEKTVVSLRDVIDFKGNVPFTNFSSIVKTDKPKWPGQNIFNNFSPTSTQFRDTASSSSKLSWPVLGMMADFKSIISKATVNQLAKPKWPFSNLQSSITKDIIKGSNATKLPQGAFIDKLERLNNATKAEPSTTAKFDKKVFEALRIDPSIAPGSRATDKLHHKLHINNSAYSNYISEKANYEQKRDSAIAAQQRVSNFSNRSAPFTTTEKAKTEIALNASNYYSPITKSNRSNVMTKVSTINLWNRLSTKHTPTHRLSKKDANLSSQPSVKEGYIYNPGDVQSLVEKLANGQSVLDNTHVGVTTLTSSSSGSKGNAPPQPQFSIALQANWCDSVAASIAVFDSLKVMNTWYNGWYFTQVMYTNLGVWYDIPTWYSIIDSCQLACPSLITCAQANTVLNNFKQTYPQYASNSLSTLWVNYLNQNNGSGNWNGYNEAEWKAFLNCCNIAYPAADTLGSRCDTIEAVVTTSGNNPWNVVNQLNNIYGYGYYDSNNSWTKKDLTFWFNEMDSCGISCNTLINCTQLSTVMSNFKQAYPQYANNSISTLWVNYLNQNNASGNGNWYSDNDWKTLLNCCGVVYPAADTLGSRCDTIQMVVSNTQNPWQAVNDLNKLFGSYYHNTPQGSMYNDLNYWLTQMDSCGIPCNSFVNCTQLSNVMNNFKQTYPLYADSSASSFWVNYLNQNNASGTGSWYNEQEWIVQLNCCGIDYPDTISIDYCDSLQFALDYYHSSNNFNLWNFQYVMGTTLGWGYNGSNGNWINYDYDHWFAQIDSCNLPCPQIVDCNLAQSAMDDFYQLYPAYVNQAPGFIWAQYLNYEGIGNGNWYNTDQWRAILNCCGISLPQEDSISTTTCDTLLVIVNTNTALSEFPDMPTFEQIRRYYGWGEQDSTGEWQSYPMSYYFGLFDSCGISCSTLFDCAAIDSAMQQFPSLYPMYADSCPDFILENYLNGVVFEYDDGGFTFDDWTVIANCCGIEFPTIDTTPALCDSMYMMNYYIHFLDTIITQEFGQDCSPAWLVNFAIANQLGLPYELSNLCGPLDSCGYTCIDTCQLLTFCDSLQSIQTMYDLIWGSNNENGGEGNAGDGKDDDEFIDFVNTILSTNYTESEINGLLLLCDTANCEAINGFWSEIEPVLATYDSCVPPLILSTVYSVSGINLTINQWCELLSNCNIPCPDTCVVVYGYHCDSVLAAYQLFNNVAQVYNFNDSTDVLADILSMVLGYEVLPAQAWGMVYDCDTSSNCDSVVVFVHQYFQPLFNSYIDSCIPPYALHVLYNLLTDMDNPYLNNLDPDSWCQLYTNCGLPCPNVCQDSLNDRCDSLLVAYDLFVHIIANYEVEDTIEFLGQIVSASLGYNVSGEDAWVILSNCNCDKVLDTYESLQPLFDMYDGCVPRFVVEVAFNASMENLPYPLDYYQICRMLRACHLPCIDTCGVVQPISCDSILQFNTMYTYALELYGQYWEDTIETYNEASNFFFGYALPYEQFLAAVDSCSETYCSEQLASANSYLNNLFESYGECTPAWVVEFAYNAVLPNMGYVGINNYAEICDLMSNCNLPCPDTCGGIGPLNCDSVIAVYDLWQHVIYNLETDDSIKTLEFIQEVVLDTVLDYEDFIALVNHCDTSLCDPLTLQIYDLLQPLINGYDSCVPAWVMEAVYSNALFERPYTIAEICEIWTTCGLPCPDTCVRSPFNCDTIIQIYNTVHIFYSSYCDGCQLEDANNITQFFTQHGLGVPLNYNQLVVLYNGCIGNDEPLLCNRPLWPPLNPTVEDSCFEIMQEYAYHNAAYAYEEYLKNLHEDFVNAYTEKCLGAINLENFEFTHPNGEYHFTLYYYDQAGNLVKTVPPGGFDVTGAAEHNLFTLYRYNSLNQLIEQHTPDAGNSLFWYDRIGKMTASRNAKQDSLDQMSYTLYDDLQRIVEVGVFDTIGLNLSSYFFWDMVFSNINATWYSGISATRHAREITRTFYDEDVFNMGGKFLRNRVATSTYEDAEDFNPLTYQAASHYHYDIHGNVRKLIQDNPRLAAIGHRYKTMDYKFDLISGKVNEVIYQRGEPDQFIHQYAYDADNRITDVFTSRDSVVFSHDAFYNYYLHGPLARTTLGGNLLSGHGAVQGLDYTYTLQGWLKGINSSALTATTDPGHDGVGIKTARDAFGFTLGYYNGDYQPAGWGSSVTAANHLEASITNLNQRSLYNGNIASMAVNVGRLNAPLAYKFGYDQLNRLATTDAFDGLDPAQNQWQNNTALSAYHNELTYDPNGNILTNKRNGAASQEDMDDLAYFYDPGTNRLNHVTDQVAAANYAIDIDNQTANNYQYDPIGNLTKDVAEGIDTIHWNVYGKIAAIIKTNGDSLIFAYDPSGNRIMKSYWNDSLQTRKATYHVRDASGNVMATYEHTADTLRLSEWALYGSSRIGVVSPDLQLHPALPITTDPLLTGVNYYSLNEKQYELSNHLGNVQATISDRRMPMYASSVFSHYETEVVSAQDYYPFGMVMPERSFSNEKYRYGFNGKENDNEVKGVGNSVDFGARIYDSRLGRWLSVDPLSNKYPYVSPYVFALNNPIALIDPDGGVVKGLKELSNTDFQSAIQLASNSSIFNNTIKKLDNIKNIEVLYRTGLVKNGEQAVTHVQLAGSGDNSRIFIVVTINEEMLKDKTTVNEVGAVALIHETINHVEKLADAILKDKSNGLSNEQIVNGINAKGKEIESEHHEDFKNRNSKVNKAFDELINVTKGQSDPGFNPTVQAALEDRFAKGDKTVAAPVNSTSNKLVSIVNTHNEQHGSNVKFEESKKTVTNPKQ